MTVAVQIHSRIPATEDPGPVLVVEGLSVRLNGERGGGTLVDDVSFTVEPGEVLCIVGESGCGKTVTARAILGLNRHTPNFEVSGKVMVGGQNLLTLPDEVLRRVRGNDVAMIFQDPMSSLNPLFTVGGQISEVLALHTDMDSRARRQRTIELLREVGIPDPEVRRLNYPHQFSGGMRQRVMIAMALACNPSLLIADEPTTALDVTTQKQILQLIARLKSSHSMAVVLITHDLGVVAETADKVMVMYAGQCVESGTVAEVFRKPTHPYTAGLLASIPAATHSRRTVLPSIGGRPPVLSDGRPQGCSFRDRCPQAFERCSSEPPLVSLEAGAGHLRRCWLDGAAVTAPPAPDLVQAARGAAGTSPVLRVSRLKKHFDGRRRLFGGTTRRVYAVDDVSFEIADGETFGLVGESGCGKSTLARCVVRLLEPSAGEVTFAGVDITHRSASELRPLRKRIQLIFQDPFSSLNPRKSIGRILSQALESGGVKADAAERRDAVASLLQKVGLPPVLAKRLPKNLSGGQRQRVSIARALAPGPKLIVADEAVSALDVSVQADLLNLLKGLQTELGLTLLFISHDLGVIRHISDRVGVMYLGKLVEVSPADAFFEQPHHPYSEALLAAVPVPDPGRRSMSGYTVIEGDAPHPMTPPSGCRFHTRCPHVQDICRQQQPALTETGSGRLTACHFPRVQAAG